MKILAIAMLFCATVLAVATERCAADYYLQKQKLEIEQQQLQLDILKYISAQNEKLQRELPRDLDKSPTPQKPSLELRPL